MPKLFRLQKTLCILNRRTVLKVLMIYKVTHGNCIERMEDKTDERCDKARKERKE
jgi:hypothetical protein